MADYSVNAVFTGTTSDLDSKVEGVKSKLNEAGEKGKEAGEKIKEGADKGKGGMNDLGGSMGELFTKLTGIGLGIEGVMKAIDLGKEAFAAFGNHTKNVDDLGAAFEANGVKDIPAATSAALKFADAMQESTGVSKESTIQLEAHAAMMGISKERMSETIETTEGLAKALGVDQNSALRMVMEAQAGNTSMLTRYMPQLKGVKDATQAYAIVTKHAQVGLNAMHKELDDGTGPLTKLKNDWDDFMVKLGTGLANIINPIIDAIRKWEPVLSDVGDIIVDLLKAAIVPLWDELKALFDIVIAVADAVHGNFAKAWEDIKDSVKNGVQGVKDLGQGLSSVGKDAAKAFSDGFKIQSESEPPEAAAPVIKAGSVTQKAVKSGKGGKANIDYAAGSVGAMNSDTLPIDHQTEEVDKLQAALGKAHVLYAALGETKLTALNQELSAVKTAMEGLIVDGKVTDTIRFNQLKSQYSGLKASIDEVTEAAKKSEEAQKAAAKQSAETAKQVSSTIAGVAGAMGSAMAGGKDPAKAMLKQMLDSLASFGTAKGTFLIGEGTADLLAGNPMGGMELAGGTALVAAAAALKAVPMAAGGIVSGSSIVNVGEYAGAAHNPEVIAPLDKLKQHLGTSGAQHHTFRIKGDDLVSMLDRVNNNTQFALGG